MAQISDLLCRGYPTRKPWKRPDALPNGMRRSDRISALRKTVLVNFLNSPVLPTGKAEPLTEAEVLRGGLPPACPGIPEGVEEWFHGYVQTYVERDVRQLSAITDLVAFRTLAQLAALRSGQVLVISNLARDAKLNAVTAGRYLDLLEASFLIQRLPPFLKNRSSRLVKSPKLHFTDSGPAAHLAGVTSLEPGQNDLFRGALVETYMAQNLAVLLEAHLPDARLGYWHEQGRHEVDFVIRTGAASNHHRSQGGDPLEGERLVRLVGFSGPNAHLCCRGARLQRPGSRETRRQALRHPDGTSAGVAESAPKVDTGGGLGTAISQAPQAASRVSRRDLSRVDRGERLEPIFR